MPHLHRSSRSHRRDTAHPHNGGRQTLAPTRYGDSGVYNKADERPLVQASYNSPPPHEPAEFLELMDAARATNPGPSALRNARESEEFPMRRQAHPPPPPPAARYPSAQAQRQPPPAPAGRCPPAQAQRKDLPPALAPPVAPRSDRRPQPSSAYPTRELDNLYDPWGYTRAEGVHANRNGPPGRIVTAPRLWTFSDANRTYRRPADWRPCPARNEEESAEQVAFALAKLEGRIPEVERSRR
ncbi:MAG: hypothetical protein MMC23_006780 [Stictis urceolatum]|nr:hypothetical protein [Stictis urceolata]